jgi:hypothetical protein
MEEFEDFLKNDKDYNPKIGDTVVAIGHCDEIFFTGQIGIIIATQPISGSYDVTYLVKFKKRFDDNLHNGNKNDPTNSSYYMRRHNFICGKENIKEFIEKKKQSRENHKHLDPFGEEEWLF